LKLSHARIACIVNPNSAHGSTGREWPRLKASIYDRLGTCAVHMTGGAGDAVRLSREAVMKGAEVLLCVGGDGTLNEVVNGVMDVDGGSQVSLGIVPRGTGCDLARFLGIAPRSEKALETIAAAQRFRIDLGKATYLDHGGAKVCRYFHNVLSFGLGGEVDARVERSHRFFGGFAAFLWATLVAIMRYKKKKIFLSVDDVFTGEVQIWNIAVAKMDDGVFQVTLVGDLKLWEVFRHLPKLYNGRIYEPEQVKMLSGKKIRAASSQRVLLDVDGEQPGRLPVEIELVPSALSVICDERFSRARSA
jgi:diacylglycerol kinase family enzyme